MSGSNNTIQAEGLGSLFKTLARISAKAGKKLATNLLRNPDRALKITSNIAIAAATKSRRAALSSLKVIFFHQTGKGFYFGNFV